MANCLLLHGWLDNAGTWDKVSGVTNQKTFQSRWRLGQGIRYRQSKDFSIQVAPLLTPSLHLVALDLPGHGHSAHLPPGNSLRAKLCPVAGLHYHDMEHLAAVRAVVTQMSWTRFSLIGHSMGVKNSFNRQTNHKRQCLLSLFCSGRPCGSLCSCFPRAN